MSEARGLQAIEIARARRRRLRILLLATTCVTGLLVGVFVVRIGGPRETNHASAVPSANVPPPVPTVKVHDGAIFVGDREVARTQSVVDGNRIMRIDSLFDALKEIRQSDETMPPPARRTIIFAIANDVPAVVVKSIFQTSQFAGYDDVEFATGDGGVIRP
jgi:hypothetical protein